MKQYIHYFRFFFIMIAVLLFVFIVLRFSVKNEEFVRMNDQTLTTERVFDYADKLSDEEENALRELIKETERKIGCDIVLVTENKSLKEQADKDRGYEAYIEDYIMIYADNFYDNQIFGFDKPYGDGAIFVDNWFREADGYQYYWFSTSGKVMDRYSNEMIENMNQVILDGLSVSPYQAYENYVKQLGKDMSTGALSGFSIPSYIIVLVALLITAIYTAVFLIQNKGRKTTVATTYVNGGKPNLNQVQDIFLTKHITTRVIETSSGGGRQGGGGGHISSGGHSHGGGGGRR